MHSTHSRIAKKHRDRRIKARRSVIALGGPAAGGAGADARPPRRVGRLTRLFSLSEQESTQFEPSKRTLSAALALIKAYGSGDLADKPPVERAAIKIQRTWRMTERLRQATYRKKQVRVRVNSIIVYCIFLAFHFFGVISPLSEDDNFHFVNNLRGQLGEVEFNEADSPTWGKNFFAMATVQEMHHWFQGPFKTFLASAGTYDGDVISPKTNTRSYALGFGRIVGGVKVSQIRSRHSSQADCANKMRFIFGSSLDNAPGISNIVCYERLDPSLANEDRDDFGPPANSPASTLRRHGNRSSEDFQWEGWNGTSTTRLRQGILTEENVYTQGRQYAPPAYGVVLDPSNWTETEHMVRGFVNALRCHLDFDFCVCLVVYELVCM